MLTVGSLFSGIGGIEHGLEQSGNFHTEWFVERDQYAQAVLRKHWPTTPIYQNITTVDWQAVPRVDMLTGGFPCQDISYAGKGAGITEGTRSGLWKEYYKAIRILRPRFVFVENVSALLSRGLDIVLGDLAEIGYDAEWHCITAASVGAPHRRDRIFIIGMDRNPNIQFRSENREIQKGTSSESIGISKGDVFYSYDDGQFASQEQRSIIQRSNSSKTWKKQTSKSEGSSKQYAELADSNSNGYKQEPYGKFNKESLERFRRDRSGKQWSVEPSVGRVAHGVSFRVDRIKCLGNSVVPQVAQFVAEIIKEKEKVKVL